MKSNIPFPKGILFDMDGVLLLTTQSSEQSWQIISREFAPTLGISSQHLEKVFHDSHLAYSKDIEHNAQKQQRDRLEPFETRKETTEQALEQVGRGDNQLASEIVRAYESLREKHRQLAPHALDILQQLRDYDVPLALLSNGNATYQRQKIKQYQLAPFFDTILIEEEFGVAKPDKHIFLAALDQLHVTAQQSWMIGDDLAFDIAGSQKLGIFAVWCDPAKHGIPEGNPIHPDWVIHTLPELLELYEKIIKK